MCLHSKDLYLSSPLKNYQPLPFFNISFFHSPFFPFKLLFLWIYVRVFSILMSLDVLRFYNSLCYILGNLFIIYSIPVNLFLQLHISHYLFCPLGIIFPKYIYMYIYIFLIAKIQFSSFSNLLLFLVTCSFLVLCLLFSLLLHFMYCVLIWTQVKRMELTVCLRH